MARQGLTKNDLVRELAKETDLTLKQAREVIDALFSTEPGKGIIAKALDAGKAVRITGFGVFTTRHRGKRQGRNPATGETIEIPPRHYVVFRAGKGLRERVKI